MKIKLCEDESVDKPGSVADSHSSGCTVTCTFLRPTRIQCEPHRVDPYLVLLPVGFALPLLLPTMRCALTAPFHPYPEVYSETLYRKKERLRQAILLNFLLGGLFSVALSVESLLPGVTWHCALWSPDFPLL